MADLSHRLAAFEEPDGLRIEPLSHALLAELAALFFEADIPHHVLMEHHPAELIAFVEIGMGEPDEKKEQAGPDETGASILRVADRYKVDPHHIYTTTPAWMLNAAIEGLPQVTAVESMQLAEASAVGAGNMKPAHLRNVQQQWRREARGQAGNGGGALSPAKRPGSDGPAAEAELDDTEKMASIPDVVLPMRIQGILDHF